MQPSSGLIAIWNDIVPAGRANFLEWHSREHIPERVGIPNFVRGRRLYAVDSAPQYLTLYDVETPAVLTSTAYLTRLNAPTAWTQRSVKDFLNTERAACRVVATMGNGSGGRIVTLRIWTQGAAVSELETRLVEGANTLITQGGVCVVTVAANEATASSVSTSEQKIRSADSVPPDYAVLVEFFDDGADLPAQANTVRHHFAAITSTLQNRVDAYALEFALGREP
jgi:hypothetical protein